MALHSGMRTMFDEYGQVRTCNRKVALVDKPSRVNRAAKNTTKTHKTNEVRFVEPSLDLIIRRSTALGMNVAEYIELLKVGLPR